MIYVSHNPAITIIIGNPPYNARQINENDNNKNRVYPRIEQRIRETYTSDSQATNRNALSDAYVKFFRWATDRLDDRDGVICFVSNNGFLRGIAFDGFRKHMAQDFTHIYHLDLGGNARVGGGGSVFGIMVGVGITVLVRNQKHTQHGISYYRVPEEWDQKHKLHFLAEKKSYRAVVWEALQPDDRATWLTHGLRNEFEMLIPIGMKTAKAARRSDGALFHVYSIGINTSRDSWMYDFDPVKLANKATRMIETYNAELSRWIRAGSPADIDNFVLADDTKIKWSSRLKECFVRNMEASFQESNIRHALYRPFTRQYLYVDHIMTHRRGVFPRIFPTPETEQENMVLGLTGKGSERPFMILVTNSMTDMHLVSPGCTTQCFPFYTYGENGANRQENITDWALAQFQAWCGEHVTKWDIFYYIYAVLHHPTYREHYAENLKRDLPHIPLPTSAEDFTTLIAHGKTLADLHISYEQVAEYQHMKLQQNEGVPISWRVEKMKLSTDKKSIIVNPSLTIVGIPKACFDYRLGNRSALEWVIDQYQVKTDSRSKITNDPNRPDDPQYIVRLVRQIVTVSVETMRIVGEIAKVELGVER